MKDARSGFDSREVVCDKALIVPEDGFSRVGFAIATANAGLWFTDGVHEVFFFSFVVVLTAEVCMHFFVEVAGRFWIACHCLLCAHCRSMCGSMFVLWRRWFPVNARSGAKKCFGVLFLVVKRERLWHQLQV